MERERDLMERERDLVRLIVRQKRSDDAKRDLMERGKRPLEAMFLSHILHTHTHSLSLVHTL